MVAEGAKMAGKITPEGIAAMRARIGVLIPEPTPYNLEASLDSIRHFAYGYGDDNPLYFDPGYAQKSRWGGLIGAPMFVTSMGITEVSEIPPEIRQKGAGALRGVPNYQSGSSLEWIRPVYVGDRVYRKHFISGVEERRSSFTGGVAVVVHHTNEYTNQRGELVCLYRNYFYHAEREASEKTGKYARIEEPHYTEEQLQAIDEAYAREERRGKEPRHWEEMRVGDELPTMVKGPLCTTDIIFWHVGHGWGGFRIAPLRLGYLNRRRIPAFYTKNKYGFWDVQQRVHWDNEAASHVGNPRAYDYGLMRTTWLTHLVTNWMGDDAWLWKLSDQTRRFNYHGDTQWLKGKVVDKQREGRRCWVELQLWAENQRQEPTTLGKATVLVPSKELGPVVLPGESGEHQPVKQKSPYLVDVPGSIW